VIGGVVWVMSEYLVLDPRAMNTRFGVRLYIMAWDLPRAPALG
jgi:hypothetical protein